MNPALGALLLGATCIALSPIFVRLSEAGPTATAFWRVALAVPALAASAIASASAEAVCPILPKYRRSMSRASLLDNFPGRAVPARALRPRPVLIPSELRRPSLRSGGAA